MTLLSFIWLKHLVKRPKLISPSSSTYLLAPAPPAGATSLAGCRCTVLTHAGDETTRRFLRHGVLVHVHALCAQIHCKRKTFPEHGR